MYELRLVQGSLLKKVIESIKALVKDADFYFSSTGFSLQAMDPSHVAFVSFYLRTKSFEDYRCDRNFTMGVNIGNMAKLLKCANNDDILTMKADDGANSVNFMFESPSKDKTVDLEMKFMGANSEERELPETDYDAIVRMPSAEFSKICKDLIGIGDTVVIAMTKESIRFSTRGDIGKANIVCKQRTSVEKPEDAIIIDIKEPVTLSYALKYMNAFTKATPLSEQVTISMSSNEHVLVEYKVAEMGYIRFYLGHKLEDEELEFTPASVAETKPKVEKASEETDHESKLKEEPPQVFDIDDNAEDDKVKVPKAEAKPEVEGHTNGGAEDVK